MAHATEEYRGIARAEQLSLLGQKELAELQRPSVPRPLCEDKLPSSKTDGARNARRPKVGGAIQDRLPGY